MADENDTPVEPDDVRREVVLRAAQAIDAGREGGADVTTEWLDDLEREVRASYGARDPGDEEVAARFVEWAEEALVSASNPVAKAAQATLERAATIRGVEGAVIGAEPILRELGAEGDQRIDAESLALTAARTPAEPEDPAVVPRRAQAEGERFNRIEPVVEESGQGARQVADFVDRVASTGQKPPVRRPGLFARLRGMIDREGPEVAQERPDTPASDDISEALRRRYAVHVSDDRKTIQLFENGARSPAITLDARSISTSHNEGVVVADVVALARDRGWQALKVAGTAEFKDSIWLEGSKAGLTVQHEPSPAVRAAFEKWDQERPENRIEQGPAKPDGVAPRRDDLGASFAAKSPEERLADPRLRNAQLELMIGIRTAEQELGRPIAEMPDVMKALSVAVREQLSNGRVFDAPFVKPEQPRAAPKQIVNPKIEADRIPPPRH